MLFLSQEVGCAFGGRRKAKEHAANMVGMSKWTIAEWVRDFETHTFLVESKRGRHSKTVSPINNETFRAEFKAHVKENSRKSGEYSVHY